MKYAPPIRHLACISSPEAGGRDAWPTAARCGSQVGSIKPRGEGNALPVFMGLEGEDAIRHPGTITFVNNVVNPSTATLAVRGVFPNPRPANGRRLLSPGMFVRVRLPLGKPHPALLVSDQALGTDQGQKYVLVVDSQNKVGYRRVKTGPLRSAKSLAFTRWTWCGDSAPCTA